jgi:hypothetical protein
MTVESFQIHFQWRAVLAAESQGYTFPSRLTSFLRDKYCVPAVYRWRVHPGDQGKPEELYIGEAENLSRRIQHVLTPGGKTKKKNTNARLREQLDLRCGAGKHVYLDYLDFPPFELNGALVTADLFREGFLRKAIENLCLYFAQTQGHALLNCRVDAVEKVARNLLKLPPDVLRRALAMAQNGGVGKDAETH